MFKFELGVKVREIFTGLTGITMGRTEYFTGCIQYGVMDTELDKDGLIKEWTWMDESRLELIEETKIPILTWSESGGPQQTPSGCF